MSVWAITCLYPSWLGERETGWIHGQVYGTRTRRTSPTRRESPDLKSILDRLDNEQGEKITAEKCRDLKRTAGFARRRCGEEKQGESNDPTCPMAFTGLYFHGQYYCNRYPQLVYLHACILKV